MLGFLDRFRSNKSPAKHLTHTPTTPLTNDHTPNKSRTAQIYTNNSSYTGQVNTQGQKHGRGIWKLNGSSTIQSYVRLPTHDSSVIPIEYDGQFLHDQCHGCGVVTFSNGDRLECEWAKGEQVSTPQIGPIVKIFYANHHRYEGQLNFQGERHGKGIYTLCDQSSYSGEWVHDLRHGRGSFYYVNRDEYHGDWVNGKKEGHGSYYFFNSQRKYVGPWKNDQRDGLGSLLLADGSSIECEWKNDQQVMSSATTPERNALATHVTKNGVVIRGRLQADGEHVTPASPITPHIPTANILAAASQHRIRLEDDEEPWSEEVNNNHIITPSKSLMLTPPLDDSSSAMSPLPPPQVLLSPLSPRAPPMPAFEPPTVDLSISNQSQEETISSPTAAVTNNKAVSPAASVPSSLVTPTIELSVSTPSHNEAISPPAATTTNAPVSPSVSAPSFIAAPITKESTSPSLSVSSPTATHATPTATSSPDTPISERLEALAETIHGDLNETDMTLYQELVDVVKRKNKWNEARKKKELVSTPSTTLKSNSQSSRRFVVTPKQPIRHTTHSSLLVQSQFTPTPKPLRKRYAILPSPSPSRVVLPLNHSIPTSSTASCVLAPAVTDRSNQTKHPKKSSDMTPTLTEGRSLLPHSTRHWTIKPDPSPTKHKLKSVLTDAAPSSIPMVADMNDDDKENKLSMSNLSLIQFNPPKPAQDVALLSTSELPQSC